MRTFSFQVITRNETISSNETDCFAPFYFTRNDRKILTLIIYMIFCLSIFAQNAEPKLHGYIQSRFTTDFDNINSFSIRRAKLWLDGTTPMLENVTYKLQIVYRSNTDEYFYFQDAFVDVRWDFLFLRVGKFVPNFTLERMQSDAFIPLLERANVINSLIHGYHSSAREIGVEGNFDLLNSNLNLSLGIFNGNQNVPGNNIGNNLLYTTKASHNFLSDEEKKLNIGASFGYRYLDHQTLSKIFPLNESITGNDYRYGFHTQIKINNFDFQSEFVNANITSQNAWGYYAYAGYYIRDDFQLVAQIEKYEDLNPATIDNEWYLIGLNYYFTEKNKLMADFKTQFNGDSNINIAELQYQIFFN